MGIFDKLKNEFSQSQETDITKMDFKKITGLVSISVQEYVDKSLPTCPFCKNSANWLIHNSVFIEKLFPAEKYKAVYHFKCANCGGILHTSFKYYSSTGPNIMHPNPRENIQMFTIDVLGNSRTDVSLAGKQFTAFELNEGKMG